MKIRRYPILFPNQDRYILFNRWDIIALILVLGILGWLAWGGAQMATPYQLGQVLPISLDPERLLGYAGLTVLRMLIALLFSLLFTFIVGSIAAKNEAVSRLMIPCIDILQSVPVLGFLSLTVTGFIRLFPGSRLGPECAAIFAIFTAQAWNMTLSFYQSLRVVPKDLLEVTKLFQLSPWQRFWRLEVPFALPGLLWNMMLSMSGSWVFLVASESISVANHTIHLPGIGSYLGYAITQGSLLAVGYAVGTMFLVILIYDQIFFRPLITWSYKFHLQDSVNEDIPRTWLMTLLQRAYILQLFHRGLRFGKGWFLHLSLFNQFRARSLAYPYYHKIKIVGFLFALYSLSKLNYYAIQYIEWSEIIQALLLGAMTALRVTLVVIVSSCVWVPIGVWIGMRPSVTAIVQPLVQFLAAFPVNVLFPLVVIVLLKFHLSVEWGVLPLMLLGAQWYILFNVIAGIGAIPKELYQIAQNLGITGWLWWKRLILPGIFPYLIIGIMTSVGAAWNLSVVTEVMQWGNTTLTAKGLGAYILEASQAGHFSRVAVGMIAMSAWVLMMNYFVWQPLYRLAQSKYKLN